MGRLIVPVIVGCLAITMAYFIAITIGQNEAKHRIRKEAIERGYALYCPTNGRFAWAGECEESK